MHFSTSILIVLMITFPVLGNEAVQLSLDGLTEHESVIADNFKEGKKETHSGNKLLAYGVDWPTIEYTKNHIGAMEKSPFDGVVLRSVYHLFSKTKMPAETMKTAIRDLKATPFNRFTDNFLNLRTIPVYTNDKTDKGYHGDWFDGEWWDVILHNAKASATVAREGGLKGIMFDPEAYHGNPWKYGVQKYRSTKSFEEYTAKVRERGREMIKAINSVYPEITFITIFSTSWTAWDMADQNISIEESTGGLMPCFIDGIIEAATPQTTIIDGFEMAYTFTEYQQFVDAADLIVHGSAHLSTIPDEYEKTMKVGFGLSQGHVAPQELGSNIRCAYTLADGYVWLWSDHATNWWEGRVVQAYADAVANNKRPLTKREITEITRQTSEVNELRKRIRPPKVAVIYSTYRNGTGGWHNDAFRALGWKSHKWKNSDLNGLMAKLDDYDMVFTEPNYNMKDIHDFRQYRAKWLSFLENGGIILVIEVQANPQQLDWVVELGPYFDLTVQTFSKFQQGSSWENPASELDFGFVKPTWAHFSHWAPQWVVSNHNVHENPIILYQKVGNGLLIVSTTYPPSFPTAKHLKTIWYLWKTQSIGKAP